MHSAIVFSRVLFPRKSSFSNITFPKKTYIFKPFNLLHVRKLSQYADYKIIKPGKTMVKKDWTSEITCYNCNCEFIAKAHLVKESFSQKDGEIYSIRCPACNKDTYNLNTKTIYKETLIPWK